MELRGGSVLRNLESINPALLRPSRLSSVSACIVLVLTLLSAPLAYGGAPDIPFSKNLIVLLLSLVLAISSILALVSAIFRWGWKARYYGFSFLCAAGISFLGFVPLLVAVLYGNAPYWAKLIIIFIYGISHYLWCRKFTRLYKDIFHDENLRATIYEEEGDAIYYMRRGDEFLLDKHYKFSQTPRDRYFVMFIVTALLMAPMMQVISNFLGIPFVHIFLLVAMLPVSWMGIGFAVRGFLIFYLYPAKIKKATGKDVFVDLSSKHRSLRKPSRSSV
jgi:hypothetical protein